MAKCALATELPALGAHGACSMEPVILLSLLSSLMVSLLNLMPWQGLRSGGGWGRGGSAALRVWPCPLLLQACSGPTVA